MSLNAIADAYGQGTDFGHADYAAAKAAGYSDKAILAYLDKTPQRLHKNNKLGGSAGLYREIQTNTVDASKAVKAPVTNPYGWADFYTHQAPPELSDQPVTPPPPPPPPPAAVEPPTRDFVMPEIPQMPEMPDIQFPGTQKGARNVSGYNALGIRSPSPEGWDLNTGGTTAAFGRKKKPKNTTGALLINPLT